MGVFRVAETIEDSSSHARGFAAAGRLAVCLAFLFGLWPAAALAAEVFTVRGIEVSAESSDAEQARQVALLLGRERAFQALGQRMVESSDLAALPRLSAPELEALIVSTEIERESIGKTRYSAHLTYRFDAPAIRQLFAAQGLRFTESVSQPLVVLPVLVTGAEARLWEDPNPWRAAWANHTAPNGLVPLLVPLGELQDIATVDAAAALAGDPAALETLAGLYGAGGVLVLQATLGGDPEAGTARLSIEGRTYGRVELGALKAGIEQVAGQSPADFWAGAADTADALVQLEWKRLNAIYYGTQSSLPVTVAINALQDWLLARRLLEEEPLVVSVQILGLSQTAASVVLTYRGTIEQLQRALAQRDLLLQQGLNGWDLRVGSGVTSLSPTPLGSQ